MPSIDPIIKSEVSLARKRQKRQRPENDDVDSLQIEEHSLPSMSGVPQVADAVPAQLLSSSDAPTGPPLEKPSFALSGALTMDASSGLVTLSTKTQVY